MLVQGDFNIDSVQMYSGSFKEALKQTMLSQEVMFRKQVLELHRLYGVQRILMQHFDFEEFDRCGFKKAGIKPSFMPYPNPARYDPLVKETKVSSIHMLEKRSGKTFNLRHRPLDLQLPADQYVSLIDLEELELSLHLGMGHRNKESVEEILSYKKSRVLSGEVIDLEDSIDGDAENENVFSLDLNAPTIQCTSNEFDNVHGHVSSDNLSIKNEQFGSYEAGYLDLNEAQNDDSSCHSNDPIMARYSSSKSSPGLKGAVCKVQAANCSSPIWVEEKNNCSTESSTLEQDANLDVMDCGSRNERIETQTRESKYKGTNAGEMCNTTQSDEAPVGSIVNFSKDSSDSRDDGSRESVAAIEVPANMHAKVQKSEVCSDGCDSILTTVSGGARKEQNLILPTSNHFNEAERGMHTTEASFSAEQDHKSSGSIESEHDEESSEIQLLLQSAAESLICMSLADPAFGNDMGKGQVDQPQHSCDSFELLVLNQAENNEEDEFSVSSQPSTDKENKNSGFKLRRGRRLKDFQREILPGLSCLSRHEICEDINILEAVLRSREYQKIRAKMQDGQKWCAPTKSKRSRLSKARRRIIL